MREFHDVLQPLCGLSVAVRNGHQLPGMISVKHLNLLGANCQCVEDSSAPGLAGALTLHARDSGRAIDCTIPWQEPHCPGTETTIQAISGLMAVHGRDRLVPARLGLEVASVAAGIISTQGVLAALIGQSRGLPVQAVRTSVLDGALMFLRHHLAIATCGDSFPFRTGESGQRPPFHTNDGHWIEIEVLGGDAWKAFWTKLGVRPAEVIAQAWLPYVYRYLSGHCVLPLPLHEATRRRSLAELIRAADECDIAMCRVQTYPELLTENGGPAGIAQNAPWAILPGQEGQTPLPSDPVIPLHHQPLAGMRVVEITSRLQGPLAGLLLHMLGAEVIKVEPPGGDFGKHSPPLAGSAGAAYLAYNRGKQCVEINYKSPEGRAQLKELVAGADVFLHNWRLGRAESLGLDTDNLSRLNPGLVYAHASGWGSSNREPCPIAGDFLVQAYAACGDGLHPPGEPPFPSPLTIVDVAGGLLACEAILVGLYSRQHTRRGCRIETSLLAGAMSFQSYVLQGIAENCEQGRRVGKPLWGALEQPAQTADGFIIIENDKEAREKFVGFSDEHAVENLRSRPSAEWTTLLTSAGITAVQVRTDLNSLPDDPRFANLVERVDHGCWLPVAPWRFVTG